MPRGSKALAVASAVYVPDTDCFGKILSSSQFKKRIREVENYLLKLFGGFATDVLEHGEFWSATRHKVISERVVKVVSFSDVKTFKKHRKELENWLLRKKKEWAQEKIGYEFEVIFTTSDSLFLYRWFFIASFS